MSESKLSAVSKMLLPEIENELRRVVMLTQGDGMDLLYHMLAYHMGWEGEGAGPEATGKRIRPLVVLLSCGAAGKTWLAALPAAASVELIHNFSLIHDDIEDNSPLRRGRATQWKLWGIPQAINAGDAMFTLAHLASLRLNETTNPKTTLNAIRILQNTCLRLTQGQFLDISYETRDDLTLEDYWPMIQGKTAVLLAACTELGAVIAGVDDDRRAAFHTFGLSLGLAFQVQDDLLGIWGDADTIGKSNESDLVSGKKSLPVLFGLSRGGKFADRWKRGPISPQEVPEIAQLLIDEGAKSYTKERANFYTQQAVDALQKARPEGEFGAALIELAGALLHRQL